jgi:hypothetical protein
MNELKYFLVFVLNAIKVIICLEETWTADEQCKLAYGEEATFCQVTITLYLICSIYYKIKIILILSHFPISYALPLNVASILHHFSVKIHKILEQLVELIVAVVNRVLMMFV